MAPRVSLALAPHCCSPPPTHTHTLNYPPADLAHNRLPELLLHLLPRLSVLDMASNQCEELPAGGQGGGEGPKGPRVRATCPLRG